MRLLCLFNGACYRKRMPSKPGQDYRSDAELIDLCNSGSRSAAATAFKTLYLRHKDYVLRVAMRYCHQPDIALDAMQETFIYLLRKFPPAGPGLTLTSQLTTLLYLPAKNSAISALRKAERFELSDTQPDELASPAQSGETELRSLLSELSAERREIVQLRFVDDMSLQDIATLLEIPLGTVKSRLHLAIKQLRDSPTAKKILDP